MTWRHWAHSFTAIIAGSGRWSNSDRECRRCQAARQCDGAHGTRRWEVASRKPVSEARLCRCIRRCMQKTRSVIRRNRTLSANRCLTIGARHGPIVAYQYSRTCHFEDWIQMQLRCRWSVPGLRVLLLAPGAAIPGHIFYFGSALPDLLYPTPPIPLSLETGQARLT